MTALYNKWRPRALSEVCGQSRVVKILKAYTEIGLNAPIIFNGQYGTGKTSLTKILASYYCAKDKGLIWSSKHPSVIEVNAGAKTGVGKITEILETAKYMPMYDKNKVYIIDECHALSSAAFEAFLCALEEVPKNVRFFMATTDKRKIPQPVLSRSFVLNLDPVEEREIEKRLLEISKSEDIQINHNILRLIAENSNGSMRDAIKWLEQCSMLEEVVTMNSAMLLMEIPSEEFLNRAIECIKKGDYSICEEKFPDVHPYRVLYFLIKRIQGIKDSPERWVPVIHSIAESFDLCKKAFAPIFMLRIVLSKAVYIYELARKLDGEKDSDKSDKLLKVFPKAKAID